MNASRIIGVMAGVAAGAALGILYAPEKGSRTRRNLVQRGEEMMGNIRSRVEKTTRGLNKNFAGTPQEEVHDVNTML